MANRGEDWYRQAKNDLLWAEDTLTSKRYAQSCFVAQQVAEKSLKSLALARGYLDVRSHSIVEIAKAIEIDGEIERMGKRLDLYYISSRYPDAFPSGAPFEFFTEDQATEAVAFARAIVHKIGELIENEKQPG